MTLQTLIDHCEADLADSGNATWSAADIEQWCRDAIADYSLHFPRTLTADITTTAGERRYDLPAGFLAAISVEYPQGEEPAHYLIHRHHQHPGFWLAGGYFDILERLDDTGADEIWLSESPAAGETIRVIYQAAHDQAMATSGDLTVPVRHQHLLRNYVLWRAALQLKAAEEATPTSNSSLLMSQLAVNSDRLRRAYVDALAKAVYAESRSALVSWSGSAEETRRVY